MKALITKELKNIFCSSSGILFSISFLLAAGSLLWIFGGGYNIPDSGYADLSRFFELSPILFSVLIPALTMRQFSEEKKNKTLDILFTRPIGIGTIFFSKYIASLIFIVITILSTVVYVYSLYMLANPTGNIDTSSIAASYVLLVLLCAVFTSIGLFASSLTGNQIVAFIVGVAFCFFSFYGFQLLSSLFSSGAIQYAISSIGLWWHYLPMQKGVVQLSSVFVFVLYAAVFFVLTLFVFGQRGRKTIPLASAIAFTFFIASVLIPNVRFDFTSDKRYTLSDYTKTLLQKVGEGTTPLNVEIYLTGDLNAGFRNLRKATDNLMDDFARYAGSSIRVGELNPYLSGGSMTDIYQSMEAQGMQGIVLNETDREGKMSQKVIYPYAKVTNGKDTLTVPLLKNITGYTAEENLNLSAESLEFEFIDAIRLLQKDQEQSVAFIEGHGELSRAYVADAEEQLSKYYFVNRGQLGSDISVLNGFDAIIIAGPVQKYNEADKYIIDQYIMNGGKVLWLVDGAYLSPDELKIEGKSASMKNEVNLDDMLFTYGVRINSDLIQDKQCASVYVVAGNEGTNTTIAPFYYTPLLIPSVDNAVTKNIRDVRASFVSSVDIVNKSSAIEKTVLLTSSSASHVVRVPETVDLNVMEIQDQKSYFDQSFIPVAVALEGEFVSAFQNRMIPEGLNAAGYTTKPQSTGTKMIVAASSDIIRNELQGQGSETQVLPMGYDRVSQQLFGNRSFIINAVNWLVGDDAWMQLRTKEHRMSLLNKQEVYAHRNFYAGLNILLPISFMLLVSGAVFFYRKRKYES